jgi:serine protease Do
MRTRTFRWPVVARAPTFAMFVAGALMSFDESARALDEEVAYAKVGWWTVSYRTHEKISGCGAAARFQDETYLEFVLARFEADNPVWVVFISNPRWKSWIARKKEHTLYFYTTKAWNGTAQVTDDKQQLMVANASVDFMNSIAEADSLTVMNERRNVLTRAPLSMKDSAEAIRSVVRCVREHPPSAPPEPEAETSSFGTGFFVAPNLLVTNNHVTNGCKPPIQVRYGERRAYTATISGQDQTNDLVLLHTDMKNLGVASFRFRVRLGESVATYGFPYSGVLSSSGNFTMGNITSLSGLNDDTRFFQISTPIQPGNSGAPLLDMSGSVIGVVEGQLNAMTMMQVGKSVPQNVNFAIRAPIVVNFLSAKGVTPSFTPSETVSSGSDNAAANGRRELSPSDIADAARKFTVQVFCQGVFQKTSTQGPDRLGNAVSTIDGASQFDRSSAANGTGDVGRRLSDRQARRLLDKVLQRSSDVSERSEPGAR